MGCGMLKVACDDGFEIVTKDQKELVALTQWHTEHTHGKKSTHDEVMKMARHP
jgi:predicted small metal-binding protein